MSDRLFPIRTKTACQLKWNWTALNFVEGFSRTCHRTSTSPLTPENFNNFHNNDIVIEDRKRMLQGLWPESNCSYCKGIEDKGGVSDRLRQIDIPDLYPPELDKDPTATHVTPTVIEVLMNNTCNLGCLYCNPALSSVINQENRKFGRFEQNGVLLEPLVQSHDLAEHFWQWFPEGFPKLRRLGFLGGEPLYQKEFDTLLEMIDQYPNPDCELNVITNLMASPNKVEAMVNKILKLILKRKIKRLDVTCSIDCWGPQQEYVRYGLDLVTWERNFQTILENKWIYLNINNVISVLTIKTLPDLLERVNEWRKDRKIYHHFSAPTPGPSYLHPGILDPDEFVVDFDRILSLMPDQTDQDQISRQYMQGIRTSAIKSDPDPVEIRKLFTFLDEKDRRRNTQWRDLFPWLEKYRHYVV